MLLTWLLNIKAVMNEIEGADTIKDIINTLESKVTVGNKSEEGYTWYAHMLSLLGLVVEKENHNIYHVYIHIFLCSAIICGINILKSSIETFNTESEE